MSTNEIGEKIYYSDSTSKVTNVRVTCNHITVPIEKIESVDVNFRIEAFCFSVLIFFASFLPFLFVDSIPDAFDTAFLFFTIMLIAASFLWLVMVFRSYIELVVSVGGHGLVIQRAHMKKNDYICKLAAAIGDAISDEKKYQKLKTEGEISPSSTPFNSSETMRLKLMLDDYEKLTAMKEDLVKTKDK
jgi:hypothetical protein